MNDTDPHQQELHPPLIAYVNPTVSNSAATTQQQQPNPEEEQTVTSTSSETLSSPALHRLQQLPDTLITSPARITSSTGNDYSSSSPQRVPPPKNDLTPTDVSSEDDSQSPRQTFARAVLEQQQQRNLRTHLDGAMPTTSAAAAAAAGEVTQALSHCPTARANATTTTATRKGSINIRNGKLEYNSDSKAEMVAREILPATVADSGGGSGNAAGSGNASNARDTAGSNANENHKIILKLPKPTPAPNNAHDESHIDADPMTSSCSNSSSNSCSAEDTRKVEPLKINLHAHHAQNVVPKITIKPIIKKKNDVASDCSSSAEDDAFSSARPNSPIPKLTIKSSTSSSGTENINSEPHIVPKLTIRSATEEGGAGHSSIVPKLTIKMSDPQASQLNSSLSSAACNAATHKSSSSVSSACSTPSPHISEQAPPPLPKLTIKTSLDGTSESIISTISPASLSSSSSSSSGTSALATSAASCSFVATAASTSCISSAAVATVPKLTIKTVLKSSEETVPKLTIKTNASGGTCVSTSETSEISEDNSVNKIPKLTIKTGQEHAVIITQHNDTANTQTIPKLTIKTKSLDVVECLSDPNEDPPPEKIPKITIKTNEAPAEATKFCIKAQQKETDLAVIPKLTISVSNSESSAAPQSPKQLPLVVRQLASTSRKLESPERVPKLMISRQDSTSIVVATNHSGDAPEKTVPKLTIKTTSLETVTETKEKTSKFAIKSSAAPDDSEKIPKLTIKPIPPTKQQLQSSEDSDECLSIESSSSPVPQEDHINKVVPKLTIKNLSSPKLKMKAVLEDKATRVVDAEMTASKKCVKSGDARSASDSNATLDSRPQNATNPATERTNDNARNPLPLSETVANGESSNSQEFCGFNDNTTESIINAASTGEEAEEPRRNSDDMDIDEGLQQHDPQVFNNVTHFGSSNGDTFLMTMENDLLQQQQTLKLPQLAHVIDTVDLTSSPSPGSSPAHFNYTDADPHVPSVQQHQAPSSNLLLERLQRETSVIQSVAPFESSNFLQNQHAAPATKFATLPPLQPKPQLNLKTNSAKYPQLAERLMANGAHTSVGATSTAGTMATASTDTSKPETVIDSIEILDTPEGSPRSAFDDAVFNADHINNHLNDAGMFIDQEDNSADVLRRNNNTMDAHASGTAINHVNMNLKRHANATTTLLMEKDLAEDCLDISPNKLRRIENDSHTMATLTILTNDQSPTATVITTSPTMIGSNHCGDILSNDGTIAGANVKSPRLPSGSHRSRKQRHEHLLNVQMEEEDPLHVNSNDAMDLNSANFFEGCSEQTASVAPEASTPVQKKRGRPKKSIKAVSSLAFDAIDSADGAAIEHPTSEKSSKTRLSRVQLLRKRLAIDMVASEQPSPVAEEADIVALPEDVETPKRDRPLRTPIRTPLRTSRRSATPNVLVEKTKKNNELATKNHKRVGGSSGVNASSIEGMSALNHFGGSNSSISSACSSSSMSSTTLTTTAAGGGGGGGSSAGASLSMATQIDLTMSSSSSSASNGSTTATVTTAQSRGNSMLPPTTILSSSDPVPDVIFKPNDFSSIMATQQLRSPLPDSRHNSQDEDGTNTGGSGADNSGYDSSSSATTTPRRGRGRGRGRGSVGSARGPRGHRLGRGASAVAKAIAMSRPRCVGGLKHTPDPGRLKGLFSPSPQVFEEDTRMSADLNQTPTQPEPQIPFRQPDFLFTNEESQSSMVSNTSILDPNTIAAVQNGSAMKRPKKKKMEVCVAEDAEITVGAIAEYDWPPPKGCCPSKNRDTFMIQEQVALYLGIKSFKRKYPDLPRRQIDMEERNWLQEKALVTERMCDLGITAVWASDILDIMYTDFYSKYEEYKDFIRQKHVREIEMKHKALGLNVTGRGLQARDRAMLSTSKWNAYFNRSRKEERLACLDLQTFTVNVPLPATAPSTTLVNRPIAEAVASAAKAADIPEPPTLLKPHSNVTPLPRDAGYPLALVPGQYCDKYRHYTPLQLRSFPLNTVLDDPHTLLERLRQHSATANSTDTESAQEVAVGESTSVAGAKRFPVRRSRRARSHAVAERTKTKCDSQIGSDNDETLNDTKAQSHCSSSSESSSSSSGDSSSETDSDSDSCSSSSSSCDEKATPIPCGVCQRTQQRNLKDLPEVFLKCYTCRRRVHPSCIEMPHRMVGRVRNYNWQCAECKCCIKCRRKQDQNKMLFCEQCDRGFHIYCLGVKAVPDGRWSCERCSICMRCGATKPEGQPLQPQSLISSSGEKIKQIKHKKVKWINEYRIDHITKLREHCSMLCVPCGRAKTTKRVQIANSNCNNNNSNANTIQQHQHLLKPQLVASNNTQMSPPAAPLSSPAMMSVTVASSSSLQPPPQPPVVA